MCSFTRTLLRTVGRMSSTRLGRMPTRAIPLEAPLRRSIFAGVPPYKKSPPWCIQAGFGVRMHHPVSERFGHSVVLGNG
jgi:hypothetical protein